MNRAEFFSEIYRKGEKTYFVVMLVCLAVAIGSRIINTEESLIIAAYTLLVVFPAYFAAIVNGHSRAIELHKKERGKCVYFTPGAFCTKLAPYALVVSIAALAPPLLVTSILFGLDSHINEHTSVLSILVLFNLIPVWYFAGVNPLFKRKVA